jgi:hypothetical protein
MPPPPQDRRVQSRLRAQRLHEGSAQSSLVPRQTAVSTCNTKHQMIIHRSKHPHLLLMVRCSTYAGMASSMHYPNVKQHALSKRQAVFEQCKGRCGTIHMQARFMPY